MSEIMSRRADAVAGTHSGLRQYCSRVTRPALTPPRELIRLILSVAAEQKAKGFKDTKISRHKTVDADQTYTDVDDVKWLHGAISGQG